MNLDYTSKDVERFWSKVAVTANPDKCWEWQASTGHFGYGWIAWGKRPEHAHRVSWLLTYGEIPDRLFVLHSCDNPSCVNPKHLFLGTHLDNARDKEAKGRHIPAKGERHGCSKLTRIQVEEIRMRYIPGKVTQKMLAKEYGVTQAMIGNIVRGDNWR